MKKVFLLVLLIGLGSYLYSKRDIFKSRDVVTILGTPPDLQNSIKVFAFVDEPERVEYKTRTWYGDGKPAILVSDGENNYGLPKEYRHADFYITIGEKFFSNSFRFDKRNPEAAYDIEISVRPVDTTYAVSANVSHHGRTFTSVSEHSASKLTNRLEVTYFRSEGLSKTEWFDK
ncbi:MAG: hypothetical protein EOP48_14320 [Sphingobacteriales bacterium]|nr:MAG: hypothetical protein EOP48_14320 [Sphingobacteriales bacterium]